MIEYLLDREGKEEWQSSPMVYYKNILLDGEVVVSISLVFATYFRIEF